MKSCINYKTIEEDELSKYNKGMAIELCHRLLKITKAMHGTIDQRVYGAAMNVCILWVL
jgi:hypothetical protein